MLPFGLVLLSLWCSDVQARIQYMPEDTYAFPKWRINFLNNRPIAPHHASQLAAQDVLKDDVVTEFLGEDRSMLASAWPKLEADGEERPTPDVRFRFFFSFRVNSASPFI